MSAAMYPIKLGEMLVAWPTLDAARRIAAACEMLGEFGGTIDARGFQGNLESPVELPPGVTLLVDAATWFSVRMHAPEATVLRLNEKCGIVGTGPCCGDGIRGTHSTFTLCEGSHVRAVIACRPAYDRGQFQVSQLRLKDFSIAHEGGDTAAAALIDLVNITDLSYLCGVAGYGAIAGIGLWLRTDPERGGALGPLALDNLTLGLTSYAPELPCRPFVMEVTKPGGAIANITARNWCVGHAGRGQAAVELNAHGHPGGIMGFDLSGWYCEPMFTGGVGARLVDVMGASFRNVGSMNACLPDTDPTQDALILNEETVKGYSTTPQLRQIIPNTPYRATVDDRVAGVIKTGIVESYPEIHAVATAPGPGAKPAVQVC